MAHAAGVEKYLVLLDVASHDGHLGHSAGGKKTWTDGPVRHRAEVLHGSGVGRETDDHQFAEDRCLRSKGGIPGVGRQFVTDHGDLLAYDLAGLVDVRAPVEFDVHDGEAGGG